MVSLLFYGQSADSPKGDDPMCDSSMVNVLTVLQLIVPHMIIHGQSAKVIVQ